MAPLPTERPVFARRTHVFVAAIVWAGLACLIEIGCSRPTAERPGGEPPKPSPAAEEGVVRIRDAQRSFIGVEEVSGTRTSSTIVAPAHVEFRDGAISQVGVPLDGRVVTVHVLVGQHVAVGDPLMTLDSPEAASMRASAAVAQSSLREARLELERQRRMQQEGVGIERDVVAAETKVSAAEAEVARVDAGAASIGKGTAAAVVVRAPLSGVVISRKASVGLAVQRGGEPLVEIGDTGALRVVADVFERDLPRLRDGARGRVSFPAADRQVQARVASVGTVVASGLRTAPVYLDVDGSRGSLKPGMYGRVEIDIADAGITLPVDAVLIKDGKNPVVYVQRDAVTFVRRRVTTAQPIEGRVQIVSGLSPGDRVVVRGALLIDGAADQLT